MTTEGDREYWTRRVAEDEAAIEDLAAHPFTDATIQAEMEKGDRLLLELSRAKLAEASAG